MHVLFVSCAEQVVVDSRTNRLSILNVYEEFNAPAFPAVVRSLVVVVLTSREENEPDEVVYQIRARLDNEVILEGPLRGYFQGKPRNRAIAEIDALVIPKPGTLTFEFLQDDRIVAQWKIPVHQAGPPKVAVEPTTRQAEASTSAARPAE